MTFASWGPCFCHLALCEPTSVDAAAADMPLNVPEGTADDFYFLAPLLVPLDPLLNRGVPTPPPTCR